MHIYYDNTTFGLATTLLVVHSNGRHEQITIKNDIKSVSRYVEKMLMETKETVKIFIHFKAPGIIKYEFMSMTYENKRIIIKGF